MVIRNRISKDRQYNGQKEKDKRTDNDTQNTTQKNEQHEPHTKPEVNPCALFYYFSNISLD